jgi:type II secretory pathway pseudopilin PulG
MRRQGGFSYVEVLVGIVMLAIVAGGLAQGLAMSSRLLGGSRVDSVAHEIATSQMDAAHRMSYEELGVVAGNPPGVIPALQTRTVQGIRYRVATEVRYVDDPALGQPRNLVNYKRVTVRVAPQTADGKEVTQTTVVAPPAIGAVAGKAAAFVTVVDVMTGEPVPGATVTIDGSTSPARSDVTDDLGRVVFAGLEPSAADPGDPQYAYRLSVAKSGYATQRDSLPAVAKQHLAATQTWTTTLKVFKPATVVVNLRDAVTGQPVTEMAEVTLTSPPPSSARATATGTTGGFTFTQIDGEAIEPSNSAYQVDVLADAYEPVTRSSALPAGYPATTTHVFDIALQPRPKGWLEVTVVDDQTGAIIPGAQVQVSGGQAQMSPRVRPVDAGGLARFALEPSGSVNYIVNAVAEGYGLGASLAMVAEGQTTRMTMRLVRGSTGTIVLRANAQGRLVRLQAEAGTYDQTQYSNASRVATFGTLAAGFYRAYIAEGFNSDGSPLWSAPKRVRCQGGRTNTYDVP